MRQFQKKSPFVPFIIKHVAWNNETTCKFPRILSLGRSPRKMRQLAEPFSLLILHRVGFLEK
jgi:hypothetical protein